ncbi:DUF4238 domain-containing protein [Aurantibacillus circumpalustris]|uniref:DUF4238 domain-containing protein n=1 Tax=Aurantibacillus circumpalustris TaxID=3036359 RepID=UPI00295AE9DB|nr:DUF4238 domain-containing protein [Aurantibacillus circumpalustris]
MAGKSEHFVPRFQIRFFSVDAEEKHTGIYNPNTGFFKSSIPLESQCQKDNFYGDKSNKVDDLLGEVETEAAPIIKNIVETETAPKRTSSEYPWLLMYTMDMAYRTKAVSDQLEQTMENSIKQIMKYDPDFKDFDIEGSRIKMKNAASTGMSIIWKHVFYAIDLSVKLIANKSDTKFIMSDNPVIRYNQFLEQKKHPSGHLAPLLKGLQILFPISPDLMLVYFDKWAYNIGSEHEIVYLTNKYDVNKLNALQVINCSESVYFTHEITNNYLVELRNKYQKVRDTNSSEMKIDTMVAGNGKGYLQMYEVNGNKEINLNLSFIRQTKQALKYSVKGPVPPFRHEELRSLLKHKMSAKGIPTDIILKNLNPESFNGIDLESGQLKKEFVK